VCEREGERRGEIDIEGRREREREGERERESERKREMPPLTSALQRDY
jgi:hypothetical protein